MFWFLLALTTVSVLATFLPFVRLPHGVFRVGAFPRVQILTWAALTGGLALLILLFDPGPSNWLSWFAAANAICILVQAWFIRSFTPFSRRRVRSHDAEAERDEPAPRVRMLALNVKLSNRDYDRTCALVLATSPDIAVFMEVDQAWIDAIAAVTGDYEYKLLEPHDTGYGMMMISRVEVMEGEVRHLLNREVPSFHCTMRLAEGDTFRLIALHPEPPTIRDDTIGRDAEIGQVGLLMREHDGPAVVFGDMNDVAWSSTTRRFLRVSRMLDPRHGRGQFNSFDARYPFLRWPLDHIFVTPHFEIAALRRLPHVGSDHFPMFYELALTERSAAKVKDDPATDDDLDDIDELIATERGRAGRRPIGYDWEDE